MTWPLLWALISLRLLTRQNLTKKQAVSFSYSSTHFPSDYFEELGMMVLDNIQVFVDDIHIRYEDATSNPSKPFVAGLMVQGIHIQSTDSNWTPKFTSTHQDIMYKVCLPHLVLSVIYFHRY